MAEHIKCDSRLYDPILSANISDHIKKDYDHFVEMYKPEPEFEPL